jgi:hypothetical protein
MKIGGWIARVFLCRLLFLREENLAPLNVGPAIRSGLQSERERPGPVQVVAEDDFVHHANRVHLSIQPLRLTLRAVTASQTTEALRTRAATVDDMNRKTKTIH